MRPLNWGQHTGDSSCLPIPTYYYYVEYILPARQHERDTRPRASSSCPVTATSTTIIFSIVRSLVVEFIKLEGIHLEDDSVLVHTQWGHSRKLFSNLLKRNNSRDVHSTAERLGVVYFSIQLRIMASKRYRFKWRDFRLSASCESTVINMGLRTGAMVTRWQQK